MIIGNEGIEFLEKCLKLTQIRDFGRLMRVHGDGFVCSRSLDVVANGLQAPRVFRQIGLIRSQCRRAVSVGITCSPRRNKRNQLIPLISARATGHCPLTLPRAILQTNKPSPNSAEYTRRLQSICDNIRRATARKCELGCGELRKMTIFLDF